MENTTIEVNYTIEPKENGSYYDNKIKSNIADDKMIRWEISKSLSDELIKKSASLKPEQLLVQYAEMQKRGLESFIEDLDNLELTMKTKTEAIANSLDTIREAQSKVWEEKQDSLDEALNSFEEKIQGKAKNISKVVEPVNKVIESLSKIESYSFERFLTAINQLNSLAKQEPKLVKLIAENFVEKSDTN